jgi:hypothetical protein
VSGRKTTPAAPSRRAGGERVTINGSLHDLAATAAKAPDETLSAVY